MEFHEKLLYLNIWGWNYDTEFYKNAFFFNFENILFFNSFSNFFLLIILNEIYKIYLCDCG